MANATLSHIDGVKAIMNAMADEITTNADKHDYTKVKYLDDFFQDFTAVAREGKHFTDSGWHQLHINTERPHLFSREPDDVNLFDVLEMIADCIHAGLTRSGDYRHFELDSELLQKAVKNTEEWILNKVEVR